MRVSLRSLHTWTGIVAGLFLSVVALTGSVILFRAEFERAAFPRGAAPSAGSRAISLDEAAREVIRVRPGSHIRRVRLPQAPGDPYIFQVESKGKATERIVSDASSGQVLGTLETGTVDWLVDVHRNLLAGKQGRQAVGVVGIVLFLLSVSGVWMWLSGRRNWRAWISVRRSGSTRRFHFELHRASGLWAYAFLALISFTGIELAYPDTFRGAVTALGGQPTAARAPKIARPIGRPLDEYVLNGRAAMADGVPMELRMAANGKGPVDLRLYRRGDLSPSGNHVYLDPVNGAAIQVDRIIDRPLAARFLAAFSPIHYGQFGGAPIKVAWALLGLSPVLLFVTGLIAWWRPSKLKPRQAAAENQAETFALSE